MQRVYLSLGSNIRPEENLKLGVRELRSRFGPLTLSPVYRNKAVGFDGDDFLNMVVGFDTNLDIPSIVAAIESVHRRAGRSRDEVRFSPRTLDIDLLVYGSTVTDGPPARLPRRDVLEYAFVLKPLADIAADDRHPVDGRRYAELWAAFAGEDELREVSLDFCN